MVKFRTEIDCQRRTWSILPETPLLFLGSCFSDEIGTHLANRGFNVTANPLGPLYNPLSIATCISRAIEPAPYTRADLTQGPRGYHCLDYASRYSGTDADNILDSINDAIEAIRKHVAQGAIAFITLGTAWVFTLIESKKVVGNCHKLPTNLFERRRIDVEEAAHALCAITEILTRGGATKVVFTVSPIRHLSDGLHGNTLSKATLHLAIEQAMNRYPGETDYFPSYEIVNDDLRDYRAYADDLVHPSAMAVDYIYEKFEDAYFDNNTRRVAAEAFKHYKSTMHRQILQQ